jgi:hypothetical protein
MPTPPLTLNPQARRIATALLRHEEQYQAAARGLDLMIQVYHASDSPDASTEADIEALWRYLEQMRAVKVNFDKPDGYLTRVDPVGRTFTYRQEYSVRLFNIQPIEALLAIGTVSYDPEQSLLNVNGNQVRIRANTNQAALLAAVFGGGKATGDVWHSDELLCELGILESEQETGDWRRVYTAAKGINARVAGDTGVHDLLIVTKYTVRANPERCKKS